MHLLYWVKSHSVRTPFCLKFRKDSGPLGEQIFPLTFTRLRYQPIAVSGDIRMSMCMRTNLIKAPPLAFPSPSLPLPSMCVIYKMLNFEGIFVQAPTYICSNCFMPTPTPSNDFECVKFWERLFSCVLDTEILGLFSIPDKRGRRISICTIFYCEFR